jgi:hypothetical protein
VNGFVHACRQAVCRGGGQLVPARRRVGKSRPHSGSKHEPRKLKRIYDQRARIVTALTKEYFQHNKVKMLDGSAPKF